MSRAPLITLCQHPEHPPTLVMQVQAGVVLSADDLLIFSYHCHHQAQTQTANIQLPASTTTPIACDNLWQHTCCEAFMGEPDSDAYLEFNFSPSGCWAVYRFDGYRARDEAFICTEAPLIECHQTTDGFTLTARIARAALPPAKSWLVGLTAVIETTDAHKSYWAIRHDAASPDFHLRSQFLLPLQA